MGTFAPWSAVAVHAQGPGATMWMGELKGRCRPGEWGAGLEHAGKSRKLWEGKTGQLLAEFASASLIPIATDTAGEGPPVPPL